MPIVEATIEINAPIAEVYRISQDYKVRFDWDPFPDRLDMLDGIDYVPAIGKQVAVKSRLGMNMLVQFVQISPPNCAAIVMVSGPKFIHKFAGSWIFNESGPDKTTVKFRYLINIHTSALQKIIQFIAISYFSRATIKRIHHLKRYCEKQKNKPTS